MATSSQIFKIDTDKVSEVYAEDGASNFSALTYSKDLTIWCGTFGNGLYYKAKNEERFNKFTTKQLPENLNIQDVLVDKNDKIWVATYGDGVYLIDLTKDDIQHFTANKNDPNALHYDDVLCFLFVCA